MRTTATAAAAVAALALTPALGGRGSGSDPPRLDVRAVHLADLVDVPVQPPALAVTPWCGTAAGEDRRPNLISGNPVHWVYVLPADGTDALGPVADAMQTDAELIDVWWKGQDPTRTPRNDLTQFSCGPQLDVSTVRLAQPGEALTGSGRFDAIAEGLEAAGLRSSFTKYVAYYDGPVTDDRICGQGGSDRTGFGLAVVYLRACVGVSTAVVAVHELVHTLGAVARSAPNVCPENSGHVCDDERDLMYPFIDRSPLATRVLDANRDDYYGNGGQSDTRASPWLVQLDGQAQLGLSLAGPGSVAGDVPGLDCTESCTTAWNPGTRVSLTATPRAGAKLVRWGGACAGAVTCAVTVGQAASVSALFAPVTYRLTVRVAGRGAVRSGRAGIACRQRCAAAFTSYVPLRLTATPARGWRFRSWAGACRGTRAVCTVPMTRASQARATFVRTRR